MCEYFEGKILVPLTQWQILFKQNASTAYYSNKIWQIFFLATNFRPHTWHFQCSRKERTLLLVKTFAMAEKTSFLTINSRCQD